MDIFSVFIIFIASAIFVLRIVVLLIRSKRRKRQIERIEASDHIVFHEEIDDFDLKCEIKNALIFIFGALVCPLSLVEVWICSYAGEIAKAVALVSIAIGYYFSAKAIDKPRRD